MLRSMYSGISGMKVNQNKLDVTGNNIANVGTTAFKGSRVTFSDMLSQSSSSAMAASLNKGGVNAKQVGLGVQISSIDKIMTQGMMQSTSRALDVAIDGSGFFMVSSGPVITGDNTLEVNHQVGTHNVTAQSLAQSGAELMYTRDGSFVLDDQGNLLTTNGFRVLGYSVTNDDSSKLATSVAPETVNINTLKFDFGPGSQLNGYKVVIGSVGPGTVTTAEVNKNTKQIVINADFSAEGGLNASQIESAVSKGLAQAGISQSITVSGKPIQLTGLSSAAVVGGVDTDIVDPTVGAIPGNVTLSGMTIGFTEESDSLNEYKFQLGKTSIGTITGANVDTKNKIVTIDADIFKAGLTAVEIQNAINKALEVADIDQRVTTAGVPTLSSGATTLALADVTSDEVLGGTPVQSIDADGVITYVNGSMNVKAYDGALKTLKIPDKVKIAGTNTELRVKSYNISAQGLITGVLEDGSVAALGQIAMASFKNEEGLTSLGNNLYGQSANSGEAIIKSGIGTLGDDNSSAYGDNLQGYLEMSNVDLAEQFTDMIVTTKAFQASGKMITTGDEILSEIINLKR